MLSLKKKDNNNTKHLKTYLFFKKIVVLYRLPITYVRKTLSKTIMIFKIMSIS
jgi:hypothetical protein